MREIKFEELSTKQKIGLVMNALVEKSYTQEDLDFILKLIKEHALGSVWVNRNNLENFKEIVSTIKEAADYPILIVADAEKGIGDYQIGAHNALGCTDSEELAYTFGKVVGATAREWGYNVICNPILDLNDGRGICGSSIRSMGSDKKRVAALAAAEIKGMHDGGVIAVGKHYPGSNTNLDKMLDSHMAETFCRSTKEELLETDIYPYTELMKQDLLDGIMVTHTCYKNIDPDFPASLSKKVIDIIREEGFDGIVMTDGLSMMGVVAKYGVEPPYSLAIAAGNDISLTWNVRIEHVYNSMLKAYEEGVFTDDDLDKAVKRVLAAQHKVYELSKTAQDITEEDNTNYRKIASHSVVSRVDEGIPTALDPNGKYCFFVLTDISIVLNDDKKVGIDTFTGGWYSPKAIIERLTNDFPNSVAYGISQFPVVAAMYNALNDSLGYENVFITYQDAQAFTGREAFTPRIISLIESMQASNRISTIVHFGNPYVLEDLPHIPRVIIGGASNPNIEAALDVLEGKEQANGKLTYDVKLN